MLLRVARRDRPKPTDEANTMRITKLASALLLSAALLGCEQPESKTPAPKGETTGLPGSLDPKARMDEVKKDYKKQIEVRTDNIDRGIERSLEEEAR